MPKAGNHPILRALRAFVPSCLGLVVVAQPPAPAPGPAAPPQARVDEAIDKGLEFLKRMSRDGRIPATDTVNGRFSWHELVFYTMLSGGVPEDDPEMQKLLKAFLEADLRTTYCVALQAMALQKLDPHRYQPRIAQCAQFLADNQCENGQWSYGKPIELEKITWTPAPAKRKDVYSPGGRTGTTAAGPAGEASVAPGPARARETTKALRQVPVKQRRKGPPAGDNSNTQYATLGLRACLESGIVLEPKLLDRALDWWKRGRSTSGGGWPYDSNPAGEPYGSMTAGALGSIAILRYYLRIPPRGDPLVEDGMKWLGVNFKPDVNPKAAGPHLIFNYYWLYSVERLGAFYSVDKVGTHDWYAEGANWLLSQQTAEGHWDGNLEKTCWAILFLRRATKPLKKVYTQ